MMRTKRWLLAAAVMICSGVACGAQDWAKAALAKSPRHGEYVTIPELGGRQLQAYVVYPEVSSKAPVVVLIHEIFGESDWFKLMADDLAEAGYIVIAPDLLSGFGPATTPPTATPVQSATGKCDPMACPPAAARPKSTIAIPMCNGKPCTDGTMDHSHMPGMQMGAGGGAPYAAATPGGTTAFPDQQAVVRAVTSLPDPQVLADLDAAADYGKKLPSATGKLYVAGFCWGGGKSFLYATHRHDLGAAFVFYGPPPPAELMKGITAPVYGFYAGNDARITATVPQTKLDMAAAGKVYEPEIYDGAGHGFMRAGEAPDANPANSAARAAAFRRVVTLLGGVR